jgi:PLP dependent protein
MDTFEKRLDAVQQRIAAATAHLRPGPVDISIVAVSKTRSAAQVEEALDAGIQALGENRVQEAAAKRPAITRATRWHLIGHLQTNKAAKAVELFDLVQSVDSLRLATALNRYAGESDRPLDILLQVNTSGAPQQAGVAPEEAEALTGQIAELPHLRLQGLMTIGLFSDKEAPVRACFAGLRQLRERLTSAFSGQLDLRLLSMGMSGDFEWALAEGSNMLRLGTVLFGSRD